METNSNSNHITNKYKTHNTILGRENNDVLTYIEIKQRIG